MMKQKKYTPKNPLRVVINRRRHLRGNNGDTSRMRNEAGSQCCLGFVGRTLGVAPAALLERTTPKDVAAAAWWTCGDILETEIKDAFASVGLLSRNGDQTPACYRLMDINDDPKLTPTERETLLKQEGLKVGIRFIFRG